MSIAGGIADKVSLAGREPLRVMVVDDSVVIRGFVSRWIEAEADMAVVASLRTGLEAVNHVERINPDVVVLDIEMPEMDGITALPLLLKKRPNLVVIISSTLTLRNAEISFKALALGAADYIAKPESARESTAAAGFKHDLIHKIRDLGMRRRRSMPPAASSVSTAPVSRAPVTPSVHARPVLRPLAPTLPRVLLIGSSTGGPQALMKLLGQIGSIVDKVPVLITQHMPATFTTILAEHIARATGRPAAEAKNGEVVQAGRIYVAPGGYHMRVVRSGSGIVIALDDGPKINFCKPAVDPLFSSGTAVWQGGVLALVLTGMGSDGALGGKDVIAAGGNVIAQDEASSVVWGMPGAVANAGLCAAVLPLDQIAPKLIRLFSGDRS